MTKKIIVTYGDSHCQGRFGWAAAAEKLGALHEARYHGPKLLHTIVNERPSETFAHPERTAFFLVAGEIDIRCHLVGIAESSGKGIVATARDLADRTASWLIELSSLTRAKVCHMIPVAPLGEQIDPESFAARRFPNGGASQEYKMVKNWYSYEDFNRLRSMAPPQVDQYTNVGSPLMRLLAHTTYRERITQALDGSGVGIMDLTDMVTGPDGLLRQPPAGVEWKNWKESDGTHLTTDKFHFSWLESFLKN